MTHEPPQTDGNMNRVWKPTHRHIKSGNKYLLIGEGRLEATMKPCIIYQAASGQLWIRPYDEFFERFEVLEATP